MQDRISVMDLCTDNLTLNTLNKSFELIETRRVSTSLCLRIVFDARGPKTTPIYRLSRWIQPRKYDNHSFTQNIRTPRPLFCTLSHNESRDEKTPHNIVSESIKVKNRCWCQITTLLSMHVVVCLWENHTHTHTHTKTARAFCSKVLICLKFINRRWYEIGHCVKCWLLNASLNRSHFETLTILHDLFYVSDMKPHINIYSHSYTRSTYKYDDWRAPNVAHVRWSEWKWCR